MMLYMLFGLLWPLHALGLLSVSAIAASRDPIVLQLVGVLAAALLPLRGVYDLLMSIAKGGGVHRAQLLQTGVELLLAAAVIVLPNYSYGAFVILFELCLTFYIAVRVVDAFIYAKHRMRRFMIPAIVQAAFFLHIFLAILLMPGVVRRRALEIGTGVAMALFGLANLCDFLALAIRSRKARTILGYIRVTAPGVLALSIPHRLMYAVKSAPIREKSENDVNLEVFFSVRKDRRGVRRPLRNLFGRLYLHLRQLRSGLAPIAGRGGQGRDDSRRKGEVYRLVRARKRQNDAGVRPASERGGFAGRAQPRAGAR